MGVLKDGKEGLAGGKESGVLGVARAEELLERPAGLEGFLGF